MQRVLEIRFPVFILVTKADRVLGFSEFFLKLDPIDQQQLVGWSNPDGPAKPYDAESFDGVYEQITTRLYKLRLKFLADEENPTQADRLYVFPEEFRAPEDPARALPEDDPPADALRRAVRLPRVLLLERRAAGPADRPGHARPARRSGRAPRAASREPREHLQEVARLLHPPLLREEGLSRAGPDHAHHRRAESETQTMLVFRLVRGLGIFVVLLFLGGMFPAYRSLQSVLNPIRTHAAQAQACMKQPCSIAVKYALTRLLYEDRVGLGQHPFLLGLFLRGAKSNEIHTLLATVQQKLFFDGVVRPLLKESEARMAALNWETFADYQAFFGALQSFLGWRGFDQVPQESGRHGRVPRGGPSPPRPRQLRPEDEGDRGQRVRGRDRRVGGPDHTGGSAARPVRHAARPRKERRRPEGQRPRPEPSHRHVRALLDRGEPRALGLEAHERARRMGAGSTRR